jgi:hypothetical protein
MTGITKKRPGGCGCGGVSTSLDSLDDQNTKCHGFRGGVTSHGGHVVTNPRVVLIYWDPGFEGTEFGMDAVTGMDRFVSDLASGHYWDGLSQYGVRPVSLLGHAVIDTARFPTPNSRHPDQPFSEAQMQSQLITWLDDGAVTPKPPPDNVSLVYLIFAPRDTTLSHDGQTTGFCGFHDHGRYFTHWSFHDNLIWATVTGYNNSFGGEIFVDSIGFCVTHELSEAFSNPTGDGWFADNVSGQTCEIGDICEADAAGDQIEKVPYTVSDTTYDVERYWSNAAAACVTGASRKTPWTPGPVVSWGPNRIDVFGLGEVNDMFHKWYDGTNWGPNPSNPIVWEPLGGTFNSPPAVVSWGPNRIDVFGLGVANDMFHKWWDGGPTWKPSQTEWEPLGGTFNSPPAVVSWGPNRIDVFGLGVANDMFHKWWDGGPTWKPSQTEWEWRAGIFNSPPAVVSWGPNRLDVFGLGVINDMFHQWYDGTNWGPNPSDPTLWEPLFGTFTSSPAVVSWGPNRIDVFGLGVMNDMLHKWWEGSTFWLPSEAGWETLWGTFNKL